MSIIHFRLIGLIPDSYVKNDVYVLEKAVCVRTYFCEKMGGSVRFKKGDKVLVKWASIDKAQYDFWKTFEAQSSSFGNPFSPTVIVKSTFKGAGCLGVWAGYGCTIDTIIIPKD